MERQLIKEQIKKDILDTVKVIDTTNLDFVDVREYEYLVKDGIWTKAIQTALDEKKNVYIPNFGHEILIDGSIFMDSNTNLKIDDDQVIRLVEGKNIFMLRNRNIIPGNHAPATLKNPDENITVSGGIWMSPGNIKKTLEWCCCVTSCFLFSNARNFNIRNIRFEDVWNYSIQISNAENFYVSDINFTRCRNDGFHLDGPIKYCYAENLKGVALGDDVVAVLAWDWYNCGMTHGDIEKVYVKNVKSHDNEVRLLAGDKIYPNGVRKTCDITDCVFEDFDGVYLYKMYYQPHWRKVHTKNKDFDKAETVGRMDNIYFDGIRVEKKEGEGFGTIPVYGLFDILADCKNLNFENINIDYTADELKETNRKFINVGPLSATLKIGDNTDDWGDLFDPDRCCTVEDIYLKNITFKGEKITDKEMLVSELHQKINPDYPNTTPEGGTGFGKVEKIIVE